MPRGTPGASALLPLLLLAACSRGDAPRPECVRFALDSAIESVVSPDLDAVLGRAELPPVTRTIYQIESPDEWSYFFTENAFGTGPLTPNTGPDPKTGLATLDPDALLISPGWGAAFWFDVDDLDPIRIVAEGSFGEGSGLTVLAAGLSCPRPVLGDMVEPGLLRAALADCAIGGALPLAPESAGESPFLLFDPLPRTRSVVVLASTGKPAIERIDRLTIQRPPPLRWKILRHRISEQFTGPQELGGIARPALFLTPGTAITTKPFSTLDGAVLELHWALLPRRAAGGAFLRVDLHPSQSPAAEPTRLVELELPGWKPEWTALRVPLGPLPEEGARLVFSLDGGEPGTLCAIGAPRAVAPRAAKRLDLVLISLDTLRFDKLGCYGGQRALTPNIDRLAKEATLFEHAYTHAPFTLPAHVSLFSGTLPDAHGVETFRDRVPRALPLLAAELADAGYQTAAFTGGGYVAGDFGFARGYDLYCEIDPIGNRYFPGHARANMRFPDGATGALERAFAFLEGQAGRPVHLLLHTYMAHCYLPPPDLAREFAVVGEGKPALTFTSVERFEFPHVDRYGLSEEDQILLVDSYDATVRAVDRLVGDVIAELERTGRFDRTILVVTSDHGEELLDHGRTGHGVTLYEEIVRVPLLIRVPGRAQGVRVAEQVRLIDVLPTLLDLIDCPVPAAIQGESFVAVFAGEPVHDRPVLTMVADPSHSIRRAIIENGYKYILSRTDEGLFPQPAAPEELFHIAADRGERTSLLDRDARIAGLLRGRLEQAASDSAAVRAGLGPTEPGAELTEGAMEHLRELGYLGAK